MNRYLSYNLSYMGAGANKPVSILKSISTLFLCFVATFEFLGAQTWSERRELATDLNTELGLLTNPVTMPSSIQIKKVDGTCGEPFDSNIRLLSEGSDILLRMKTGNSTTQDLLPTAHTVVCDLDSWLWHTFFSQWRSDTGDSKLNFDGSCTTGSTQEFFTVDEDIYPFRYAVVWSFDPWIPLRSHYAMVRKNGTNYFSENFSGRRLFRYDDIYPSDNVHGAGNIWIGRRNQDWTDREGTVHVGEATKVRRAHNIIQFDYRYYNDGIPDDESDNPANYNAYPDTSYVLPWIADPGTAPDGSSGKARLDSVVYAARMKEYPDDECDPPTYMGPQPDASITLTVYYTENVGIGGEVQKTVECTKIYTDTDPDVANDKMWDLAGASPPHSWMKFEMDTEGNVLLRVNATPCSGIDETESEPDLLLYVVQVRTNHVPEEYCDVLLPSGGTFDLDEFTGNLVYTKQNNTYRIHCLDFCEPITSDFTVANVIGASAQTFSSDWKYDSLAHGKWLEEPNNFPFYTQASNIFETGEGGKWRPQSSWVYRTDVKNASWNNGTVYDDAGVFIDGRNTNRAFELYNWRDESAVDNTKWLNATTVTQYAPSGEPVEEHNILDIYSTAKLGHKNTVPLLIARNTEYDAVGFTSFEEKPQRTGNWGETFDYAHAGKTSYKLRPGRGAYSPILSNLYVTDQILRDGSSTTDDQEKGLLIKFWVKREYNAQLSTLPIKVSIKGRVVNEDGLEQDGAVLLDTEEFDQEPDDVDSTFQPQRLYKVAQTGQWSLYQLIVDNFDATKVGTEFEIRVAKQIDDPVWIDDLRAQPLDAQMTCYVYDRDNLRLLTQFDDQHFGLFYQYNGEGKLVRKLKETERGMKTIAETQYHLPLVERYTTDPTGSSGSSISPPIQYSSTIHRDRVRLSQQQNLSYNDQQIDLLNLQIGPNGPDFTFFGDRDLELPDFSRSSVSELDILGVDDAVLADLAPSVPKIERLRLIKKLIELQTRRKELDDILDSEDASDKARKEAEEELQHIDEQRRIILRDKLGLDEIEAENFSRELQVEEVQEEHHQEEQEENP